MMMLTRKSGDCRVVQNTMPSGMKTVSPRFALYGLSDKVNSNSPSRHTIRPMPKQTKPSFISGGKSETTPPDE